MWLSIKDNCKLFGPGRRHLWLSICKIRSLKKWISNKYSSKPNVLPLYHWHGVQLVKTRNFSDKPPVNLKKHWVFTIWRDQKKTLLWKVVFSWRKLIYMGLQERCRTSSIVSARLLKAKTVLTLVSRWMSYNPANTRHSRPTPRK